MEDSYTVHRRRKAAARRREKTPEPPRRHQDDVGAGSDEEEEEETRARMERLVQETERLEELEETERKRLENEKSGDYAEPSVAEKHQRALKRAVSPEVRRKDEEIPREDKQSESKLPEELPASGIHAGFDKSDFEDKELSGERKKASSAPEKPEVEEHSKDSLDELPRKPKKEHVDTTPIRAVRRRHEIDRDLSPSVVEKSERSSKKALPPDFETVQGIRTDCEWRKEAAGSDDRARKITLRTGDDEEEEKEAAALDKNRYEAAPLARESDAVTARFVIGGKSESVRQQDFKRDEEERGRSSKNPDEHVKPKKRDVTASPIKARSSENRTAVTTKRAGKERNFERTGYTTDSSETEETAKRILRRKKSPEGAKSRNTSARKTTNRSRATTDTDGDVEELEKSRRAERRSTSRRRASSETDEEFNLKERTNSPSHSALERREALQVTSRHGEKSRAGDKRSTSRARAPSDTDDDLKPVRKSGTFPVESSNDKITTLVRSNSEIKKQIIPLSDDSLIEDFERAQREYLRKERGILDRDPMDDYVDPKMEAALRRRKFSVLPTKSQDQEVAQLVKEQTVKRSWLAWIPFFGMKAKKEKVQDDDATETKIEEDTREIKEEMKKVINEDISASKKVSILEFFRTLADFLSEFRAFVEQNPRETRAIRSLRNRCVAELLLAIIYCGLGAFVFRFTEGAFETFYKCGVKRVKRDFLDSLWNFSHNMREDDWKSMARRKLMEFEEQLHTAHEAGVHSYSGQKSWSFLNAVVYCLTVITTIGYGHISPSTTTGRAITIVYAIFGIPMFLIILADFGKLFTRGIKFLWAFVRRVYYTGSCRRVRRTVPVQEVMKGVQLVYDLATFRRPSQMNPEEIEEMQKQQNQTQTVLNLDGNASTSVPGTPGTPAMSTFAIDDEFNLPISVAIVILLAYIFVGATIYNFWEEWGFFESFYFVFISMSTIGFGDYVPKHPIYMMLSIVYLVFGLALTSMCINVVQVMLSDSFRQASQKIGATIGFEVAEDDGSIQPAAPDPVELADVHTTIKESESKEQVAPKAKQEDVEL